MFAAIALGLGCVEERPAWSGDPLASPQTTSLLGEPLYALPDTLGVVPGADAALAESPDDVELLLTAARARWDFFQYRQAIALYTRAIELAPDDWRPYTFRAARHISLREFDEAQADLDVAHQLTAPNWNVAYYQGLLHILMGRFDAAADVYVACLEFTGEPEGPGSQLPGFHSCAENATDVRERISMTEWAVRALLRAGRQDEATRLLDSVEPGLAIDGANRAYYHDLLFYKGLMTEDELLSSLDERPYRGETVGYGVANWHIVRGDTARAVEILDEIAVDPWWPGFGRIAAEAELVRLRVR